MLFLIFSFTYIFIKAFYILFISIARLILLLSFLLLFQKMQFANFSIILSLFLIIKLDCAVISITHTLHDIALS